MNIMKTEKIDWRKYIEPKKQVFITKGVVTIATLVPYDKEQKLWIKKR